MSNHTIDLIQTFTSGFVEIYTLLIIVWILASWVRLPYSVWINRIRTFVDDTVSPFVALFRRVLPRFGPLDLSPMVAIIALQVAGLIVHNVLNGFRPGG